MIFRPTATLRARKREIRSCRKRLRMKCNREGYHGRVAIDVTARWGCGIRRDKKEDEKRPASGQLASSVQDLFCRPFSAGNRSMHRAIVPADIGGLARKEQRALDRCAEGLLCTTASDLPIAVGSP